MGAAGTESMGSRLVAHKTCCFAFVMAHPCRRVCRIGSLHLSRWCGRRPKPGNNQAQSWRKPRRVVAKVEWHPGELYPRVGFIVSNLARPAERVGAKWSRLSCQSVAVCCQRCPPSAPRPRLQPGQFHADAGDAEGGGGTVVAEQRAGEADQDRCEARHGRCITFQTAEVAVSRQMFQEILSLIARLRAPPVPA